MCLRRPQVCRLGALALTVYACIGNALAGVTDCSGPLPHTVRLPAVSVPADLPVGQAIPGASALFAVTLLCVNNTPRANSRWYFTENRGASFTAVPGLPDVYTVSGLPAGIGLRIRHRNGNVLAPIRYGSGSTTFDIDTANPGTNALAGSFEMVRTAANVTPGSGVISLFGHVHNQVWANQGQGSSLINLNFNIRPATVATCRVTRADIAVSLPTVGASSLATAGATAGSTGFGIDLNCQGDANPQIHMTDATSSGNDSTTLSLSVASTAAGVGIQILHAGVPVRYGPAPNISVAGALDVDNRIDIEARAGLVTVPFQARYIRTDSAIRAGTVRALAVFNLSYR